MWFKKLTGFEEASSSEIYQNLEPRGNKIYSIIKGKSFQCGQLQIATLKELRTQAPPLFHYNDKISVQEIVSDVQKLHCDPTNEKALFQAASQFNLLEMVGPHISPEAGIDRYEHDYTQGPACAISCGAGLIYRNYFVPIRDQIGQTEELQIDCLDLIGEALNNSANQLWKMKNGYALFQMDGLLKVNKLLGSMTESGKTELKEKLKIGIQWETEVTIGDNQQLVSQAYCSALPVAYHSIETYYWAGFAQIILEAAYEATLYAGLINYEKTGCNKVFFTLLGGGAFGNELHWITDALQKALTKFNNTPLEVKIVSYGKSEKALQGLLKQVQIL